ncbi:MAG: TcfC E-set like domain-containing protein [Gammaproteobacteria bacterium]|nr:TcfC E-set like domain-containing protein [Gammaproteobacteria bacterium]
MLQFRPGLQSILALLVLAGWALPSAAQPVIRTAGPPPGFEAFHEVQRTLVDFYYGGEFLLSAPASYGLDHIEIENPSEIIAAIPDLRDPDRVLSALTGPLDTHEAELCIRPGQSDCGRIDPGVAAVIFDPSRFQATLFVNPEWLEPRGPNLDRFLPRSDAGFSVLQNVLVNASGTSRSSDSYTVSSITALSYRETHAEMVSSYGADDRLTIDSLAVRREVEGTALEGGLYRSRSQSLGFVSERDLYGIRYGRSLNTRADRAFSGGTPLEVFLSSRSRVEIIKDGRLLSTRFYDAGNRVLDTSTLPEGAYDLTLRILESDGTERIEEQFFVKTTRLPPADQPLYFVELGRIANRNTTATLPEDTGDWLARAGTTRRITADSGVDLGVAASRGEGLVEAGFFRVGRAAEFQASTFVGSDSDRGIAAVTRINVGTVRISADYRRVHSRQRFAGEQAGLASNGFEQIGANLRMPFAGGNLGLSYRSVERDGDSRRDSQKLTWDRAILRTMNGWVRLTADIARQEGDWLGLVGLRLDLRSNQYSGHLSPNARWDQVDGQNRFNQQTDGRLAWQRFEESGERLLMGVSGSTGPENERLGADGEYQGRLGLLRAGADHSFGDNSRTTWAGTLNTSLLSDGRQIAIGGQDQAQSAALVDIEGDVPDAHFEVRVDGFTRAVAPVGSVTPVHLRPWETYEIRLRPVGSSLVSFEDRSERITLYPGNVVRLNWQVAEVLVLFGRLLDPDGQALEGWRIEGTQGLSVSDLGGLFQAEVFRPASGEAVELAAVRDGQSCRLSIDVGELDIRNGIARVGTRRCVWD